MVNNYYTDAVKYPPRTGEADKILARIFQASESINTLFKKPDIGPYELAGTLAHMELDARRLHAIAALAPVLDKAAE